jgi:hypothetical protein
MIHRNRAFVPARLPSWLLAGLMTLAPLSVRAQTETEVALAEALYRQARDLMAAGNYDEACPKFAESYRLDRATGTVLNLAACYERQGKLASAWLAYSDGLVSARRDGRADRVKFAADHLAELEPKLSRVTLIVPADADEPGLEVALDGAPIGRAARGVPTPVDPGRHVVEAKAVGKVPFSQTIEITALAQQASVTIPKLVASAAVPAVPPPIAPSEPPPANAAPEELTTRPIPTSAYVAGGTTIALAVAATVTGIVYLGKRDSYNEQRASGSPEAQSSYDSAHTLGTVNAVLWGATAGGAVLTTVLYLTRPTVRASAQARVAVWAVPGSAGFSLGGGF